MKKWFNYSLLFILTILILTMIFYIAYTGKDLIYAKYITGITALLSLWYSVIQYQNNDKEKEAKVIIELSYRHLFLDGPPNVEVTVKNNSSFSLSNVSLKLTKELFFDGKNFESAIKGYDITANDNAKWVLNGNSLNLKGSTIRYTLFYYDNRGNKKKIKGKVINRL